MQDFSPAAGGQIRLSAPLLVLSIVLLFFLSGCTASKYNQAKAQKQQQTALELDDDDAEDDFFPVVSGPYGPATAHNVLKTAFSQVGRPYKYAGNRPESGFDCSGFTSWVFGQYGIKLARGSGDQMGNGKPVKQSELRPGDLVFFGRKKRVTHVGIYTGDNKYIHSPSSGKRLQESNLDDRARGEYYVGARRVLDNRNAAPLTDAQRLAWAPKAHQQLALAKKNGQRRPASSREVQVASAAPKAAPSRPTKHKVVSGDTFLALAKKYEVSAKELARANKLSDQQIALIKPGQTLIVPPKAKSSAQAESAVAQAEPRTITPEASSTSEATPVKTAAASPPPAAKAVTGKGGTHKVAAGETFNALALKYGVSAKDLARANNLSDQQIALIKPGQTLVIPGAGKAESRTAPKSAGAKVIKHKVASGDTLYGLARKYGISAKDLAKANNLDNKQMATLRLGQTLLVPSKN